jgi:hypothetical protein
MILPDFVLVSRANQCWPYSGIDSPELCLDARHFDSYPHKVEYLYNNRGYRDQEWPESAEQLKNSIWCLGDSFTVGLGSPVSHTWPCVLQQVADTRTINVSMDGASNSWIQRKAVAVCQHIQPKIMIIHWSYITRGELLNNDLDDEQRRIHYSSELIDTTQALLNFKRLVFDLEANKAHTRIIHSFIPEFAVNRTLREHWNTFAGPNWPACPMTLQQFDDLPDFVSRELQQDFGCYEIFRTWCEICQTIEHVPEFSRLDRARDGHHYDLVTAQNFVGHILELLHGQI